MIFFLIFKDLFYLDILSKFEDETDIQPKKLKIKKNVLYYKFRVVIE